MKTLADVILVLRHVYGPSYFGSGGGFGAVRGKNAVVLSHQDNGFCCGPREIAPADPALPAFVAAYGGDCIGDNGREWAEAYVFDPETAEWSPVGLPERATRKLLPKLRWQLGRK